MPIRSGCSRFGPLGFGAWRLAGEAVGQSREPAATPCRRVLRPRLWRHVERLADMGLAGRQLALARVLRRRLRAGVGGALAHVARGGWAQRRPAVGAAVPLAGRRTLVCLRHRVPRMAWLTVGLLWLAASILLWRIAKRLALLRVATRVGATTGTLAAGECAIRRPCASSPR